MFLQSKNHSAKCAAALVCAALSLTASAQPRYNTNALCMEKLNRGVVALRQADGSVAVSWRTLPTDTAGQPFDVYRNGIKLNSQPLTSGGTFFIDKHPAAGPATYQIRGGVSNGEFTVKSGSHAGYLSIALDKPADGVAPDGRPYTYSANDASVGDVDGDGQYEIFLKWDPSNSHDNAHSGFTGSTLIDCYRLDGTKLWRVDLGRNIRSGAHYNPFIVYDLDGDGRAELMVKTADGTVDGTGRVIGDASADWREGAAEAAEWAKAHPYDAAKERAERAKQQAEWQKMRKEWEKMRAEGKRPNRQNRNRRPRRPTFGNNLTGRILKGPEYITVFDGLTGRALDTQPYSPQRGDDGSWGDSHGNRSERYLAAVGYFGQSKASAVFCRGYYTRTVLTAWNWDGHKLSKHWVFDSQMPGLEKYAGQGNHNLRVADVDGDGYDEITYGSMAVDHNGKPLYNTRMGHGDAMHLTVFDPTTDQLWLWDCHENRRDGSELRDAKTGKVIFQLKSKEDVGRCMAADIDPTNPGLEMWSSDSKGIRNIKGDIVKPQNPQKTKVTVPEDQDGTALYISGMRLPTNSAVWWDGDLLREMLDHNRITKYNWTTGKCSLIKEFEGCTFNNGTKSNPCLSADLIGDWREEVLVRTTDSKELRLYVSPVPTDHRINCLMTDIPYRLSVASENVAYNQPPHTGFYLGPDKTAKPFLK